MLLVIAINTIYPLVATYDVCANFDTDHQCLQSGALYYLDFNTMIELL